MKNVDQIRLSINKALEDLSVEIANHQAGCGTVSNLRVLNGFKSCLMQMLTDVAAEKNFDKDYTSPGMGKVIIDSWPLDSTLGKVILRAEQLYKEFYQIREGRRGEG